MEADLGKVGGELKRVRIIDLSTLGRLLAITVAVVVVSWGAMIVVARPS